MNSGGSAGHSTTSELGGGEVDSTTDSMGTSIWLMNDVDMLASAVGDVLADNSADEGQC
jgi:hypothetical protein